MNQFPPSPWVYHKGRFEFFQKFAEICAAQGDRCRWYRSQMKKSSIGKFLIFFLTPLCSRINIWINFFLHVHFKLSTVWYCCHYLPPVSLTPVANLPPVSLIPAAIFHRCCWYRWCIFTCKYLCEFLKKFVMNQMIFSGAWGKMIHEKNLKQKISLHCSFNAINSHLPAL